MENLEIYQDIAKRTDGDIYVGVVGPVRTGKSTFIKNFMENMVIPNIDNEYKKERAIDELPQSAAGRTIMTTEPKFIPNEAININLDKNINFKVRLVDCVGYLVDNALGYLEDNAPRMVKTPWSEKEIPFEVAAEIGTRKVISEHSTIGILITTDGSITGIPREDYIEAEERVVKELKEINKPFIIVLNTDNINSLDTIEFAKKLEGKYEVPVLPTDCLNLDNESINTIFGKILYEFNIDKININYPKWLENLSEEHTVKQELIKEIKETFSGISKIKDISEIEIKESKIVQKTRIESISLGTGTVNIYLEIKEELFYQVLTEISTINLENEGDLFVTIAELAKIKKEYEKIQYALASVRETGYGIVYPGMEELLLEEPEIVKQGARFGIKLKAKAPSIHMIRADIETEVSPIVGSEKQSEELVNYLLSEFESDPKKIWSSNIFGKSLHELVNEGLQNKLCRMPEDAQGKLQETLERIVNEGSGGLICIIL